MTQRIADVMSTSIVTLDDDAPLQQAAARMRDEDIGDVIVLKDGEMCGIVTDRDITVRAVADGQDVTTTPVAAVCSEQLVTLSPDDTVTDAARRMREAAVRRMPVIQDGRPVGIVSIGDLAIERDPDSALADISAAEGNR